MPAEGKDIGGAECLAQRSKIIGHLVDQSYPLQLHLITSAVLWSKHVFQPCALSHTCSVILFSFIPFSSGVVWLWLFVT